MATGPDLQTLPADAVKTSSQRPARSPIPPPPPEPAPVAERAIPEPGRNCWRIERARRLAFLVDGADCLSALRAALLRARHSIFILGRDIDSRVELPPLGANDGLPAALGDFLNALVAARRHLHAHLLCWDYAMLFATERAWLPALKPDWNTHRRVHFRFDDCHPTGASHHQKIVVIDDRVAFIGGCDLTRRRRDTPAHDATDPLRRDPDGNPCPPLHDVQAIVEGDAAAALGELARERWCRATGRRLRAAPPDGNAASPWPPHLHSALCQVDVAIARTDPSCDDQTGRTEIRQFYDDAIAAAQHRIFLENPYFSAASVGAALAARLAEPQGPDIALIAPQRESGWLEQSTMDVLRARLQYRLDDVDHHGRFRAFCPVLPGTERCLDVHSKVMIVDDDLLTIGSANLSNRSMGLDTECNLVLQASGQGERTADVRAAIAALRNRLLAEHLGSSADLVATATAKRGLIGAIEHLRDGRRTLQPLPPSLPPDIDAAIPDQALLDPEQPVDADQLLRTLVPPQEWHATRGHIMWVALAIVLTGTLAAAWHWTPLRQYIELDAAIEFARQLRQQPLVPLLVLGIYTAASLAAVPITLLIATTGLVFGPWLGLPYALGGSLLAAAVTYGAGRGLGRDLVRRYAGKRINRLNRQLAKRGVVAVTVLRLLPVAPFAVVNMVAGAAQINLRHFLVGTLLGMAPGIVMTLLFVDRIVAALRKPTLLSLTMLAALVTLMAASALLVRHWPGWKRRV